MNDRMLSILTFIAIYAFSETGVAGEIIHLPQVTPGPEITLGEALRTADERNLTLAGTRKEIEKAEARLSQAWGMVLPTAQADMQYSRADHADEVDLAAAMAPMLEAMGVPPDSVTGESMVVRRQDDLTGSLSARLPLVNLQSWKSISAASQGVVLSRLTVEDTRQTLLAGVAQAYFVALMSRSLVDLQETLVKSAAHHLEVAQKKFEAGSGLRIDVIRAETDLEQARQDLTNAHLALDTSRDALGVLTGLGGLPMPLEEQHLAAPENDEKELVGRALSNRSDIKIKQATSSLMQKQLDATWMQFLPTLDFIWRGSYQFTEPGDMGSADRSRWTAMLTLSVPIYNHFRYGDLDERRAALAQAMLQTRGAELSAGQKVRQARRNYLSALASVDNSERQVDLSAEGLDLVLKTYAAGAGSSLEVTDARRTAAAAQVSLVTTCLKSQIALLKLLRAIGEDMADLAENRSGVSRDQSWTPGMASGETDGKSAFPAVAGGKDHE